VRSGKIEMGEVLSGDKLISPGVTIYAVCRNEVGDWRLAQWGNLARRQMV
jgi:hypothetical protein